MELQCEKIEFLEKAEVTILEFWDGAEKGRFFFGSKEALTDFNKQKEISDLMQVSFVYDEKNIGFFKILSVFELPRKEAQNEQTVPRMPRFQQENFSTDSSIQTINKASPSTIDLLYEEYQSLTYGAETEKLTGTVLGVKPLQTVQNVHYFWAQVKTDKFEIKVYFFGPDAYKNIQNLIEKRIYTLTRVLRSKTNDSRGVLDDLCYFFGKNSRIIEQRPYINNYGTLEEPWRKPSEYVSISELTRLKNGEIVSLKGRVVNIEPTDPQIGAYDIQLTDEFSFCKVTVYDSGEQYALFQENRRIELQQYLLCQLLPYPVLRPTCNSQIKLIFSQYAPQTPEQNTPNTH